MRYKIFGMDIDDMMSSGIKEAGIERVKEVYQLVTNHTGLVSPRTITFYLALMGLKHLEKVFGLNSIGFPDSFDPFENPIEFINSTQITTRLGWRGDSDEPEQKIEFIYFIQNEDTKHIKIGYSNNPSKRLILLQCGNSSRLNILAVIPGDRQDEKEFHEFYKSLKIRGEWFKADEKLMNFIESIEIKVEQTCPDCGKAHNIFEQATWKICCLLNFDFLFPVKEVTEEEAKKQSAKEVTHNE